MSIYKLIPALKDYIWGGTKLKQYRQSDLEKISESWELSFHPDGPTKVIVDGQTKLLKDVVSKEELGVNSNEFSFFPVLIKLIDAKENLSVQVHPSDDYALKYENSYGKTEMWYVIDAEEGAGLYVGFKEDENIDNVKEYLNNGTILEHLNFFKVKKGDCFFIKSGTIHAIGKGVSVIEIQQNSNLTYRLYDYNRVGADGKTRPLHIEKALKVIDVNKYRFENSNKEYLGKCKYFTTYLKDAKEDSEIYFEDTFASITFLDGEGIVNGISYGKYDSFFISAKQKCTIKGTGKYVLTCVEK